MIWHAGKILEDNAVLVSLADRTFEHGLGLFETLRTWNGHATLLDRHLERMACSARELGLPFEAEQLPDRLAVEQLVEAAGLRGHDVGLRITMSGGPASSAGSSVVWMRLRPLAERPLDQRVSLGSWFEVAHADPLARHKTLNYWRRRIAHEQAVSQEYFDAIAITNDPSGEGSGDTLIPGTVWETSRANLFAIVGDTLFTPSLEGPVLPGIMRGVVLGHARELGMVVQEGPLAWSSSTLRDAEVFLTNSGRGIVPVHSICGIELEAPGNWTRRVWESVRRSLESGAV